MEKKYTREELEGEERNVKLLLGEILQIGQPDAPTNSARGSFRGNLPSLRPERLEEFRQKLFDPAWNLVKEKDNLIMWSMKASKPSLNQITYKLRGIINLSLAKTWESFLFVQKQSQYLDKGVTSSTYLEGAPGADVYTLQTLYRLGSPFTPRELITTFYCCEPILNERYFIYETPSYVSKFPKKKGHVRANQFCKTFF